MSKLKYLNSLKICCFQKTMKNISKKEEILQRICKSLLLKAQSLTSSILEKGITYFTNALVALMEKKIIDYYLLVSEGYPCKRILAILQLSKVRLTSLADRHALL